ncbi:MAG: hypothetical protein GY851_22365 [bacterium]|nr:hypothetical protein [bacterium]
MKRTCLIGIAGLFVALLATPAWSQPKMGPLAIVVQDAEGRPVEGAQVHCVNWSNQAPRSKPLNDNEKGVTDADGRVEFSDKTAGQAFVRVSAGKKGGWFRMHGRGDDPEATVTIDVGRTVRGTVRDVDGAGVPGVTVLADACLPTTETDASGRFAVTNVGVGYEPQLAFLKKGYASTRTRVHFDASELSVVLKKGVALKGVVLKPDGTPASGAAINCYLGYTHHIHAGEDGAFAIPDAPVGETVQVSAHVQLDDVPFKASARLELVESQAPIQLRLEKIVFGAIHGRVVHTETKKPVRGRVMLDRSNEFYNPDKEAILDKDGRFLFDGLYTGTLYVFVLPADETLYQLGGPYQARVKDATPLDITLEVGNGCSIRGRVLTSDGDPVTKRQVMWKPMPHYRAIWTRKDGSFVIPHLDGVGLQYTVEVGDRDGRRAKAEVGPLKAGQIAEGVELRLPGAKQASMLSGSVVNEAGDPLGNVRLNFWYTDKEAPGMSSTVTDDSGVFALKVPRSGAVKVDATVGVQIERDGHFENLGKPCEIVGENLLALDASKDQDLQLTVRMKKLRHFVGRVVDPDGKPVNARVELVKADGRPGNSASAYGGTFAIQRVPEGGFMAIVTEMGYKARVLFPEEEALSPEHSTTIVLEPGPFARGESVWEAVTGTPPTEKSVAAMPEAFSERIRSHESSFYRQANPPKTPPAEGPPPSTPRTIFQAMRIIDENGEPVKRVLMELHSQGLANESTLYRKPKGRKPQAKSNPLGVYDFPMNHEVVVSAPGTGRVYVRPRWTQKEDEPTFDVVLQKAASLEIRVTDATKRPMAGTPVYAGRYAYDNELNKKHWHIADTDAKGVVRFEGLAPGFHALGVGDLKGAMEVLLTALESGKNQAQTVAIVDAAGNRPQAILQRLRREWRSFSPRNTPDAIANAVTALSDSEGDALRHEVRARLKVLPTAMGWRSWTLRELRMLAALSIELNDRKIVSNFEERLRNLESGPEWLSWAEQSAAMPLVEAIVALEGNAATKMLASVAGDPELDRASRVASLMGLGKIATPESAAAFAKLRDEAYAMPGAPLAKESYTHAERMAEAAHMVFWVMTLDESNQSRRSFDPKQYRNVTVSEDYATGELYTTAFGGATRLFFRRVGDEWLLERIGGTIMH